MLSINDNFEEEQAERMQMSQELEDEDTPHNEFETDTEDNGDNLNEFDQVNADVLFCIPFFQQNILIITFRTTKPEPQPKQMTMI